jgi:hypothetical protein
VVSVVRVPGSRDPGSIPGATNPSGLRPRSSFCTIDTIFGINFAEDWRTSVALWRPLQPLEYGSTRVVVDRFKVVI